jgi:hypothetical protein
LTSSFVMKARTSAGVVNMFPPTGRVALLWQLLHGTEEVCLIRHTNVSGVLQPAES